MSTSKKQLEKEV